MKDIGNGLNYAEAIISQAIPGLKVCIEYQIRQTFSLAFPKNCIIGRHDHSVSGPHLHSGLLWDISTLHWAALRHLTRLACLRCLQRDGMVTQRIRVETRDGNFVKELGENDFSLWFGENNTSGERVLEWVVQTSGSRETKECLWTRMPCHPWERRGWPGRSRAIYLSSSSGRDHKTCLFSFEAGLKPSSPDGRGNHKTYLGPSFLKGTRG